MSDQPPSQQTVLFDPERLKKLAADLSERRRKDPATTAETILAELDETAQSLYREPLKNLLRQIDSGEEFVVGPGGSQSGRDSELPTEYFSIAETPVARPDATLDSTPDRPVALPPAARLPRQEGQQKGSVTKSVNELPQSIGKFEIKGELGRGAFGVVYLGYDRELQRNVAIKLSLVTDQKIQERLRIEASKAAQIESNGIVPVYHIGKSETGATYIVQKYIQGSTLRGVMDEHGPLSPAIGVRLIREIAIALEPAHRRDILHRDLKPDNVLIDDSGKPWIADFGLAISEDEQQGRRGELAGTPAYMSPEQIKGRIDFLDPRSDIWSLGVMLYECLSGKLPFNGRDRRSLADQICEMDPRPLHQRSPLLGEEINAVFLRCCAKKPADRFASTRELITSLDGLILGGLSDQNVRGSTSAHIFGDSTLIRDSTWMRSASVGTSTHLASGTSTNQESLHSVSRSADTTTTIETVSSREKRGAWTRLLSQVGTFAVMIGASLAATHFYLKQTGDSKNEASVLDGVDSALGATVDAGSTVDVKKTESAGGVGDVAAAEAPAILNGSSNLGSVGISDGDADAMDVEQKVDAASKIGTSNSGMTQLDTAKLDVDGSQEKPWVVKLDGTGSHRSIQAAIEAGPAGSFITLYPGKYVEQLRIAQPVTIQGMKDLGECELENADGSPLTIVLDGEGEVILKDLVIDAQGHRTTEQFNAVNLESGSLTLDGCQLKTTSFNCVKCLAGTQLVVTDSDFLDSRQFAISTFGHKRLEVRNSRFKSSGLQVIGGPALVNDVTFLGVEGIYADRTLPGLVDATSCTFDGCFDYGIAATNNATVIVTDCDFLGCKVGAQAVYLDESDLGDENIERPGTIEASSSRFEQCTTAIQITGGDVTLREQCKIIEPEIGIGMTRGKLSVINSDIENSRQNGISIIGESTLAMKNSTIDGSGNRGIDSLAGTLTIQGGSIRNSKDVGIYLGDKNRLAQLSDLQFTGNQSAGLVTEADGGKVTIQRCQFLNAASGIYAKARESLITIDIANSFFGELTDGGILAGGPVQIRYMLCDFGEIESSKRIVAYSPATIEEIVRESK